MLIRLVFLRNVNQSYSCFPSRFRLFLHKILWMIVRLFWINIC